MVLLSVQVDYLRTSKLETLEGSIGRIQVDNQIFASQLPVLLYPSLPEKGSKEETTAQQHPTLHVSASKEPTRLPNVEIFKVSIFTIMMDGIVTVVLSSA